MPLAYSYLRFSSPEQARGDSIRRQTEATADWCQRNRVTLDASLTLRDEGVSAFRGKNRENPDVHGMAAFLEAVRTGRVPRGSFLILENLDRLTREDIVPAVNLFTGLLVAGIKVVQLRPTEQVFTDGADMTGIMLALVELSRGNSESRMKSERIGAAWSNKRKLAREKKLTRRVPGWIIYQDGVLSLDPVKAETVRRVYLMAIDGQSLSVIARTLNAEKVPLIGRASLKGRRVVWSASTVHRLLNSRATIGEYHPHRGRPGSRKPAGAPIPDYYPAVVTREEHLAALAAVRTRQAVGKGRPGRRVNLFAGLLRDARTGGNLIARHSASRGSVILPADATNGRGERYVTYPFAVFESAILGELAEVKVDDVRPGARRVNRAQVLAERKAELDGLVKKWQAKMDRPELVDMVADKLAELERERREVADQLAVAEQDGAMSFEKAVGELRLIKKALAEDNGEDNRVRCRAAIRRAVEAIWCLFIPGKGLRIGAVQVWFKGGGHRGYLLACKPAGKNARGSWPAVVNVKSLAFPGRKAGFDLRDREQAAELEDLLSP
jgi:DNA invertase Pin-like site-specific DNA recombinase